MGCRGTGVPSKSIPGIGAGERCRIQSIPALMLMWVLLRIAWISVYPVTGAVGISVRRYSLLVVWPQCATVSSS